MIRVLAGLFAISITIASIISLNPPLDVTCTNPAKTPRSPEEKRLVRIYAAWHSEMKDAAKTHSVDCRFIAATIAVESGGYANARGKNSELGLTQIKPATAVFLGVDPRKLFDPEINVDTGTRYLKYIRQTCGYHKPEEMFLAYNQGPEGARNLIKAGLSPEDHAYVERASKYLRILGYPGI
ncbi:MAG: Lytic transglycosylase catalytic [Parcubacteria group bacterium GW2011_GWA1_47_8]|nr:MAG: Lytic transglycosylase catalytic [Parcubacteria group bacterium GW2011_GWA1_47_8]KKW07859.1 MAG: Lytic transglycosylase catalytic [Parcubacteria group bacterium GW2011_GWA2_49_16]